MPSNMHLHSTAASLSAPIKGPLYVQVAHGITIFLYSMDSAMGWPSQCLQLCSHLHHQKAICDAPFKVQRLSLKVSPSYAGGAWQPDTTVQLRALPWDDYSWSVTYFSQAICHAGSVDHDSILSSLSVRAGGAWEHDVPVQHGLCHGMAPASAPPMCSL